jgi:3-oxoacyl-[acyl-carrier-protein] synthase II
MVSSKFPSRTVCANVDTISDGCTSSSDALGYASIDSHGRANGFWLVAQTLRHRGHDADLFDARVPTHWKSRARNSVAPFSSDRDGFVLAKARDFRDRRTRNRARTRRHAIAEISGYGATVRAYHRVALKEPRSRARHELALDDAQIDAHAIDYANLHGTATSLNDPLENRAVNWYLGSVLTMCDEFDQISNRHPQGASGAAGVAEALAAMENDFVPPTINLDTPDPLAI